MNLELLDPFGRQVPDRVDATLQLPESLVPIPTLTNTSLLNAINTTTTSTKQSSRAAVSTDHKQKNEPNENQVTEEEEEEEEDWKAAYHVAFNRRGKYVAVGYGSSKVAIYDVASRSIVALYDTTEDEEDMTTITNATEPTEEPPPPPITKKQQQQKSKQSPAQQQQQKQQCRRKHYGVSSLSWSRRSRTLLVGASGDPCVRLYDMMHPYGPDTIATHLVATSNNMIATATTTGGTLTTSSDHQHHHHHDAATTPKQKEPPPSTSTTTATTTTDASNTTIIPPMHTLEQTKRTGFTDPDPSIVFVKKCRTLSSHLHSSSNATINTNRIINTTDLSQTNTQWEDTTMEERFDKDPVSTHRTIRHPCTSFEFPHPVAGSLQIHPSRPFGIAVLQNLDLVAFAIPKNCFVTTTTSVAVDPNLPAEDPRLDDNPVHGTSEHIVHIKTIASNVTCAALDPRGDCIYAASKDDGGMILGFSVRDWWSHLAAIGSGSAKQENDHPNTPMIPSLHIPIKSSSSSSTTNASGSNEATTLSSSATSSSVITVWHIIISRNGKFLIANCADGAIRLYNIIECWKRTKSNVRGDDTYTEPIKPTWVFQDVVTKVKFASCDFSGDGEYVVGGTNFGADHGDKYELYIWNSSTGALMDKLTGASTRLFAVAWHPTRPFLAVACGDGITDLWGPRINWTAFAPDFQALPMNVEYIEREDEFDVDEHGRHLAQGSSADDDLPVNPRDGGDLETSTCSVDVITIEPVPAFASDSEDECDVFTFDVRVKNQVTGKYKDKTNKANSVDD